MVEAQEIIQKDDFECHMQFNEYFYESEEGKELSHSKDITYLHCNKGKFVLPACEQRWQIAIVEREHSVSDILVSQGSSCL